MDFALSLLGFDGVVDIFHFSNQFASFLPHATTYPYKESHRFYGLWAKKGEIFSKVLKQPKKT